MQRKTKFHSLLALLMALIMLLPLLPAAVFAEAGAENEAEQIVTEVEQSVEDTNNVTENIPIDDEQEDDGDAPPDEDNAIEEEAPSEEEPPIEDDAPIETVTPVEDETSHEEETSADEETPQLSMDSTIENAIITNGHAYVRTVGVVAVYDSAELDTPLVTIYQEDAVLLATELVPRDDVSRVKVWLITEGNEIVTGYVTVEALAATPLSDDEAYALTSISPYGMAATEAGDLPAFIVAGEKVITTSETPIEEVPTQEPIADESEATEQPVSDPVIEPVEEATEQPVLTDELPLDEMLIPDEPFVEEPPTAQIGDFVSVTTATRVYPSIDETIEEDYDGDEYMGVFVSDAAVQVEAIEQDSVGRYWFLVRYMYGDDFVDGTLKWTDTGTAYVLASETGESAEQGFTVTDYAYPYVPRIYGLLRSVSPMNGFSLKNISVYIPTFYAGQSGLYGSSGKDSDYLQIAKSTEHGTIYATPHYLDGFTVYCLEHNLSGPGERISGGGQEPTGPYMIVDIDSYRNNPGYSSIIYNDATLHAIAWVIRHTYPFMALDRSDSDNLTWSRVAGQFAIREVIKQMEGSQYVRSYWDMGNFYRASGQAPEVYLEYARWLAANGIARGRITGSITASGKSTVASGNAYIGTVTLTTDADMMRVPKSVGSMTGNTAGSDGSYYFLNSGDTISVTSTRSTFSITVESVSSADEEASFLVGVPSVEIQKVLIPQYGAPYKLKSTTVKFDVPLGSVKVTKKDAVSGAALSGAVFELLSAAGSVVQTQTTSANGVATFANLQPGTYRVREKSAPQGYTLAVQSTQNVTVTAGNVSTATFTNDVMTAKIRIVKKDQLTKQPLAGVEFTVTRLSVPAGRSGVGEVVAVLTTDANGAAETGWLTWSRYKVEETKVPEHFVNSHYSTIIEAYEDGKTYTVEVENEPTKGWLRIRKTDALDAAPIAGVTFEIYYNDEYGSGMAGSMTTDANGIAVSPALRKGSYIVKERDNPVGYVTELVELDAVIRSDETTDLRATNQPIQGKIRIVKKDQLTKEALAGAEFTITRVRGLPSHNGNDSGEVVATIITDVNGIAESPLLTWGTYRVEETHVPPHFVDNAFSTEVVIDAENLETYEVVVENEPTKGFIKLTKTDRQNGNPIEGVQFDVYYNDEYGEGLVTTMVTGKDGVAISEPLRKGRYLVREHGATAGYVFEEIALDATVKSDETTELHATNCHITVKLKLYKRDAEEYDGDNPNSSARHKVTSELPVSASVSAPASRGDGVLTGAVFRVLAGADIKDRQGNVVYAKGDVVIESLKTEGGDASVTTGELWPGVYEIVEVAPPVGFQPSDTHFFVDARSAALQSTEAIVIYEGLKTNEILYGAFGIVKFTGDNEVHSDAGVIETPEKGAEFEVYLKRAGSYANARDVERDYLVTNKYGRAETKALPYGVYVLRQIVGADGYAIMRPIDVMIDGTEDLKDPPTLILNNQAIHYRLRIVKLDAETGKPVALAGTAFKLKDADGNYVKQKVSYPAPMGLDTFVTNESGEVTMPETVTWGQYFVEEVTSPEGYLLNAEDVEVFVGHTGDAVGEVYEVTVEVPNTPVKGSIIVEKKGLQLTGFETMTDAYGNEVQKPVYEEGYLAGVTFEVRAAETIIGKDGTVWYEQDALVDTITTTAAGADTSKRLSLGKYYLVETFAPEGYVLDGTHHEVELAFADNQTPLVTATVRLSNTFLSAEISLVKEIESLKLVHGNDGTVTQMLIVNAPGTGFVFGLYSSKDIPCGEHTLMADTLVATGATGEDGSLMFTGYFPHGDYYIKELSAPAGWKLNPDTFPVTLDPAAKAEDADVIRVALPEPVHDELICTAVTITKMDITGQRTLANTLLEIMNDKGETVCREYTDEDGCIPDVALVPGRYTFREVLAPEGYSLSEAVLTFEVDAQGNVTGDTVIRDDYARFFLLKQDENGQPLAGVEFGLFKEDGTLLLTAVSDEKGVVTFEKVPYGRYYVAETKPLRGYVKSNTKIQVTVDGTFINPDKPLATIVNQRIHIHGIKVDTSGQFLAGVEFSLINADTGVTAETVTSNEKGEFILTRFDCGNWIIRETKAPEGFLPMQDITLHVDESWTEPAIFTCVNIPNRFEFVKTDSDGKPLSGVKFVLEDAHGNTLRELESDEKGIVRVDGLALGSYVIRETEALEGYQRSEETLRFTIDENYVVASEMPRFINYKEREEIQTGFEMTMTPVMWAGVVLVLAGAALIVRYRVLRKKHKRRRR